MEYKVTDTVKVKTDGLQFIIMVKKPLKFEVIDGKRVKADSSKSAWKVHGYYNTIGQLAHGIHSLQLKENLGDLGKVIDLYSRNMIFLRKLLNQK